MKKSKYYCIFQDHALDIYAFNFKEAIILACAKSIENAQNFLNIVIVINLETNEKFDCNLEIKLK
jgi:uncharacterized protein (UPF0276 family)